MRSRTLILLTDLVVLLLAPAAQAGPVEQLVQVAFHPSNPDVMVVRYVWGGDGMFFTSDRGKSWHLACDSLLFEPIQNHSGKIAIAGDGTTMMGIFRGLFHDDGHGCSWGSEPKFDGEWMADITPHPSDPNLTFAVTSTASPMGQQKLNGVVRRDVTGAWSDLGTKEELLITGLYVVSHGNGLRFYAGAVKGQITPPDGGTPEPNYVARVSDDEAQTWQEYTFGTTNGSFRLQGVDPSNPDRIVASINRTEDSNQAPGEAVDSVLVSTDRGAHFTEYMTVTEIGGVAFAPDGRVWIGDLGSPSSKDIARGLWFAPSLAQPATKLPLGDYPVQCLGYQKATQTLYACQHFEFGPVNQDDGTFTPLLTLAGVKDFVSCGGDVAATCKTQLCGAYCGYNHFAQAPVCSAYTTPSCGPAAAEFGNGGTGGSASGGVSGQGGNGAADAGRSDAGLRDGGRGGGDAGSKTGKASGCSCAVTGAHTNGFGALALIGLAACARFGRRRRMR